MTVLYCATITHLILLPQDSLIFLLLADLLVISKLLVHLLSHGRLPLDGHLVLQQVLGVLVGKGQQPGGHEGADGEDDGVGGDVDGVNPPVEPHRDGGHDEGVAVEQGAGLGRVILAETLEEQLLLSGHLARLWWHSVCL